MENAKASNTADRELVMQRTINAPKELVYQMWTTPEHIVKWWGPYGFSNTIEEMDVRAGGIWRYNMIAADGTVFPNKILYEEVVPNERLVYLHGGEEGYSDISFHVTVIFEAVEGQTRVTMKMVFASAAEKKRILEVSNGVEGNRQLMNRLEYLLAFKTADSVFTISRVFDAPVEQLYQVHSEAEHLAKWWGPKEATTHVKDFRFTPGGIFHYSMEAEDGRKMWGRLVYKDIVPQERIVLINSFSDEVGGITKAPMMGDWPLETLCAMSFEDVGGKTKLTVQAVPIKATDAQHKAFVAGHESMNQGYGGMYEELTAYLEQLNN